LPAVSLTTAVDVGELAHRADTTKRLPGPTVKAGRAFDTTEIPEKSNALVLLARLSAPKAEAERSMTTTHTDKQRIINSI
jgi:hypothetical protein